MHPVIRVEKLSKLYRLGQVGSGTLHEDLNRLWARMRGKEDPLLKIGQTNDRTQNQKKQDPRQLVWALKDIDFEIQEGDVLGVIGKNGSGKSTLLKLLSRVTSPTLGKIKIKGRIASLLEVGTGFHPDLSGRENIFLNGAILGMRKTEIRSRLDEIIDFSGCARYIDTPVKRYSSGMYVRLAFAVAAHLDPEILVVDEVLAVGDAEFQDRCLGKMRDVATSGRTVMFVSHNLSSIRNLCNKGLLLENGTLTTFGDIQEVLNRYKARWVVSSQYRRNIPIEDSVATLEAKIETVSHCEDTRRVDLVVTSNMHTRIAIDLRISDADSNPIGLVSIGSLDRRQMISINPGKNAIQVDIDTHPMANGNYRLSIDLTYPDIQYLDRVEDCLSFTLNRENAPDGRFRMEQKWNKGSILIDGMHLVQNTLNKGDRIEST